MMITSQQYAKRRKQVFNAMADNSIAILPTATEKIRSRDHYYRFYPDNNFYYLTGFSEPQAVAVLIKQQGQQFILFNRANHREQERWLGSFAGQKGAVSQYGADESYDIASFDDKISSLLLGKEHLYYAWGRNSHFDELIATCLHTIEAKARMGYKAPNVIHNIEPIIGEMRLIKSEQEIELMTYAAKAAARAHKAVMKACRPGLYEYQLQAELTHVLQQQGCVEYPYDPIVASGNNACTLHYCCNQSQLKAGELLLVDAGGEYHYYASDITRTFPINGCFNENQKLLYNWVLAAQLAGMKMLTPKNTRKDFIDAIAMTLTEGLVELGILYGNLKQLVEDKAYATFYCHSPGHWLGLDTHDVGNYRVNGKHRRFQENMVLTNEPGLYIPIGSQGVDKKWWGMGVRIEDDVVITKQGHKVLSSDVPKTVEDIEALMQQH